jgi:signal peptidase I
MARDSEALVAPPATRTKSTVREWLEAILVAILLALGIRTFVVQAFKIPSGSMLPTLEIGDHILVNKFVYGPRLEVPLTPWSFGQLPGLREPRPGDVIVFVYPRERDKDFIKRVIAVGGQTIEVRRKQVYIDGKPWDDSHVRFVRGNPVPNAPAERGVRPCGRVSQGDPGADCAPFTVPAGHVFVMGDNRDESFDSRFWGPVPIEDIKGLALVIYWSWGGDRWVRWSRIGHHVD